MIKTKYDKSIKTQLLISFFFIVFLMVLVGIASIYYVRKVYKNGNRIYVTNIKTVDYLKDLNLNMYRIDNYIVDILEKFDGVSKDENREQIEKIMEQNARIMYDYENLDYGVGEKELYENCKLNIITFNKYVLEIIELVDKKQNDEAKMMYKDELMHIEVESYNLLDELAGLATQNAENSNVDNYNSYQKVVLAIVVTMILTTVLAAVISISVSNRFTDKLRVIQRWAKRISEYNVSEDIGEIGRDEFGITAKALNDSQFMIRDLVEEIMEESTMISDTGKEVSDAIRKSKKRIEDMNLEVSELSIAENEYVDEVVDLILDESISPEFIEKLKKFLDIIEQNSLKHEEFCKELTSIATYMEQIAITSDYQNEMAKTHRDQVGKFKISSEN